MKQLVPTEALVIVWCIGIIFGYFLAWMRFKRAYLLIDKERLKYNQAQTKEEAHEHT